MEKWKNSKKKVSTLQEEETSVKEPTFGQVDDQSLIGDLDMLETEARRMEKKKKEMSRKESQREDSWKSWWDGENLM